MVDEGGGKLDAVLHSWALLFFSGELRQRIAGITGKKAIVESTRSADATTQTSSNCGEQFPKKRT
jgi:hypothetical protein